MATIPNGAIIVIVIVGCLAVICIGAAATKQLYPESFQYGYSPSHEQGLYMRSLRLKNRGVFHRESMSMAGKDIESRYTRDEASSYGNSREQQQQQQQQHA